MITPNAAAPVIVNHPAPVRVEAREISWLVLPLRTFPPGPPWPFEMARAVGSMVGTVRVMCHTVVVVVE